MLPEIRLHGRQDLGQNRCSGVIVEIDAAHSLFVILRPNVRFPILAVSRSEAKVPFVELAQFSFVASDRAVNLAVRHEARWTIVARLGERGGPPQKDPRYTMPDRALDHSL